MSSRWARALATIALTSAALGACASDSSIDRAGAPDCGDRGGTLVEHDVAGIETRADSALVYLPACYDQTAERYPTLWLMHGGATTADMWINHPVNAVEVFDEAIGQGTVAPLIVAMPNGATGRPEFTADEFDIVLADIDATFRTVPEAEYRAVAGVSAGGTTAAYLAAENVSTDFAALGLFMTVWGPSLNDRFPAGVIDADLRPAVLVDIGEDDGLRSASEALAGSLERAGVEAQIELHPGGHDAAFVGRRFPDWFEWLAGQLP